MIQVMLLKSLVQVRFRAFKSCVQWIIADKCDKMVLKRMLALLSLKILPLQIRR